MNALQQDLLRDMDLIWDIVKLYHPDVKTRDRRNMNVVTRYSWVVITLDSHKVHLGIKSSFKKIVAWRFVTDSLYKFIDKKDYGSDINVHDLCTTRGIRAELHV